MSGQRKVAPDLPALVLGLVLAVGVCFPLAAGGRLFLLDWVVGSHPTTLPTAALGLNGGLTTGAPATLAVDWLVRFFGPVMTWLPLAAFFPVAAVSISRLVGGSLWSRLAAATVYCVNPFVFDRVYAGHVQLLLGYALLPLATRSAVLSGRGRGSGPRALAPALWWAVLTALSPHFAWIFGIVVVAATCFRWRLRLRGAMWLVLVVGVFALLSAYIVLPHSATQLPVTVGDNSLATYRTTGDPHLGLFVNVLGLYGFWRLGPQLPKDVVTGWPFLLLAMLVVAAVGANSVLRSRRGPEDTSERAGDETGAGSERRILGWVLLVSGVAGFFLALGDQGPTGALFRWAYFHVPFFDVMREPEKFSMLLALAYAAFFAWGVDHLVGRVRGRHLDMRWAGAAAVSVLLPLAYTPTMFDGLAGQVAPSTLPASWQTADRLMGNGPGKVLFLPWHLYLSFPFTRGRVIANPAPSSFRRDAISGDNVEAGNTETTSTSPRSAYLQALYSQGSDIRRFGLLVAPLGVKYVVLAKTVDFRRYGWLAQQLDLSEILDTPSLEVWSNDDYAGVGGVSSRLITVPSVAELVAVANAGLLPRGAAVVVGAQPGTPLSAIESTTVATGSVRQVSPVAYALAGGEVGWVTADPPYQKGWAVPGRAARASATGTLVVASTGTSGTLTFGPWSQVRLGYEISGGVFVLVGAAIAVQSAVERRRGRRVIHR